MNKQDIKNSGKSVWKYFMTDMFWSIKNKDKSLT